MLNSNQITKKMNTTSIKCKLVKPCKKALNVFKFKLHRPVCVRALRRQPKTVRLTTPTHEGRLPKFLSVLHSLRQNRENDEMDRLTDLKSFSDAGQNKAPYSSPITPAYIRMGGGHTMKDRVLDREDDVDDACRSFESYLIDMILEDGKMRDLVEVEELLNCWKNLKSPIFIDLVSRYYGEMCKDLFSNNRVEGDQETIGPVLK